MALFKNLQLTKDGQNAVNEYVLGTSKTPISLSAIAIGDGEAPANPAAQSALVHEVKRLPIETSTLTKGVLTVTARLSTDSITSDITHREIGLYSGSTLFAYANAGDDYDFIPAAGQNTAVIKRISCKITVGTVGVKLETIDSSDYITYAGALQRLTEMMPTAVETNVSKQLPGAVEKELKKQLPPAVKTSVTEQLPELAPPAMKECAPPIVREVIQGFMDNGQWNEDIHAVVVEALNEDAVSTRTTPEPTNTHTVSWVHLDARHTAIGKLDYITIDTSSQSQVDGEYALVVYEQDEVGGWQFLAASRNATHFQLGQPVNFNFRGVELHGRAIRFFFAPPEQTDWTPDNFFRCSLRTSPVEEGDETVLHEGANLYNFIPRFTLGYCAPRCAPYSHIDDASHVGEDDRANWNGKVNPEDLELALYTPDEKSVEDCSDVLCFNYLHLDSPLVPIGELRSIDWLVRKSDNTAYTHEVLSLGVFLPASPDDANPVKLAISSNKVEQTTGALMHFEFAPGTFLTGAPIRLVLLREGVTEWDTWCKFGAQVRGKNDETDGETFVVNDSRKYQYVPQLKITAAQHNFAPSSHVADTSVHVNAKEKEALQNLVENPPTDGADGTTLSEEQLAALNWLVENKDALTALLTPQE